jgi:predicted Zn-dependent peptidase
MIKEKKLKNGLRFISAPIKGTKTVTALFMVATGSKYEEKSNNGISHFLEHMFFKGTKKRPNTKIISGELDSIGANFNAFTSKEMTGYWIKADSSKIDLVLDVLSDMLLNSKFDAKEINREKGTIIEEVNMYHDNPLMYIEDVFEECLYGNTPAGWDVIGTKENILNFKRKDFVDYFKSQYGSNNSIFCLAGDIKPGAEKKVDKYFSVFSESEVKEQAGVKENQSKPNLKLIFKDSKQATISLGVRAYPANHKDEYIAKLLSVILGGSMSSRLFIELRERKGLAYYIRTQVENYTDSGYLSTQAGVPVEKIEDAIKIILREYKKISKTLVSKEELKQNKDLIKGRSTIQLEVSDNVANWYARQAILRDKLLSPEEMYKKINKIKAEDIRRVAKEIFVNKNLNLAIIGPYKDSKRFVKILKL